MKILLLAGTGVMGTYLSEILIRQGIDVYITSRNKKHAADNKIKYIIGNAGSKDFISRVLKDNFDVIVDFMVYEEKTFKEHLPLLLSSTHQYIFLSSSRVYAQSQSPITEESERLLDVCSDKEYISTNEYALKKAREENMLMKSGFNNWTIIRPYITYGNERLQLGTLEKEQWLYRALKGRSIVFCKDIADKLTTLTYGYDVSRVMAKFIGNENALGEIIHITSSEAAKWQDILNIYLKVIYETTGITPKTYMLEDSKSVSQIINKYQIKYDRLYDRIFDNKKAEKIFGNNITYTPVQEGIQNCLREFITGQHNFRRISWKWEAYADILTNEKTPLKEILSFKEKVKYLVYRYMFRHKLYVKMLKH